MPGTIPTWLSELSNLRSLSLWGNELTGTIPTALRGLDKLEFLNLSGNKLTGTVPTWMGELSNLWLLWLRGNELTGPVPTALQNLDNLESLNLGGNDLTGAVPVWLGELSNLRSLRLSDNELTGTVPGALAKLKGLEQLEVAFNPLTGTLPQDLTQLPQLARLDISATAVCAPADASFLVWLASVESFRGETCNRSPAVADPIPAQTLTVPESRAVTVAAHFTDPDDDELTYTARPTPDTRVAAIVSGHTVWLSPKEAGAATVAVTACDPDRLCADQTMRVTVEAASATALSDREALEAFYDATGGGAWTESANWKTTASLESWYGVTIGTSGRVTGLDLQDNGLTGAIPAALRNLDELEVMDLRQNSLAGPIPSWLGSLSSLRELDLAVNELTGSLPAELGNLGDLRDVSLCCNEFTGSIPAELGNLGNLQWLSLQWNNLTGPLPTWGASLSNLRGLGLGGNELTGSIPTGLGSLSHLRWLALGPNDLTPGSIPAELGNLTNLERLWLGRANRTGPIPPELGNLTNLRLLSLYGNGLAGAIPDALGGLTALSNLYLDGNFGLSGSLPSEWQLPDLEDLDIFLTQSCAPEAWQEQLETIEFRGTICGTEEEYRTVDVAVFYTPPARDEAGGTDAIEAGIDLMMAATNQALTDGGVQTRVALVARSEVPYAETGVSVVDLRRLRDPSDGYMDDVHEMGDRVGADLVHLIVGESDFGGRAQVPGVFGLSLWPGGSFPHELGHNLGLQHDRYVVSRLSPDPAYGYVNPPALEEGAPRSSQWRTIMAYPDQCRDQFTTCFRVPRFSNPRQRYSGDPIGITFPEAETEAETEAPGLTGPADAAAVLDVTGPVAAARRDRPPETDPVATTAARAPGPRPRAPVGVQTAPPGASGGLFSDALLAAQAPNPRAAAAPGFPASSDSRSLRSRLVAVDFGQLDATATDLVLNLFGDAVFTGLVQQAAPTFSGGYALSGRLAGVEFGTVTLVVNGGIVAGMIWTPEATYRVSPVGGGLHAVRQVDRAQLPPLGDPLPRQLPEGDMRDPPRRR